MKKLKIDQFHPSFSYGDAIGQNLLNLRKIFCDMGFDSRIYAVHIHDKVKKYGHFYEEMKKRYTKDDVLLVHYSIWSDFYPEVLDLSCKKILVYHNITPPYFFKGYNSVLMKYAQKGLDMLRIIKDKFIFAIADSKFNKSELEKYGYKNVQVVPITLNFRDYDEKNRLPVVKDEITKILFVGRIAPNKKQEDIIKTFYYYKKHINEKSQLILVGNWQGMESYKEELDRLVTDLNLEDVVFTGHITFEKLLNYYSSADIFLCMSEHEGFCVPLIESMYFNLPIIAYNSSAIKETLGDCGIIVNKKDYKKIAELINIILTNNNLREKIINNQKERVKLFELEKLKGYLKPIFENINQYIRNEDIKHLEEKHETKGKISILTSDGNCGIHEYSKTIMRGLQKNGYEVKLVGVKKRNSLDLKEKLNYTFDSDIVIIEHEEGIFNSSDLVKAMKKLKRRNIKIILSPHELEIKKFSQYRSIINTLEKRFSSNRIKMFLNTIKDLISINMKFMKLKRDLYLLGNLSNSIIVHSKKQMDLIDTIYCDKNKLNLVPLPSNIITGDKTTIRETLGLPKGKFIFIIPGFIFRRKRYIEVIRNLPSDAILVIAGTESKYEQGYLDEIKKYISENKIKNVVINNDYDLMEKYVLASDVVVLYYKDIFQSANASLAIGAEKPCIFSNIPGFYSFEGTGIFVSNEKELKKAMIEIMKPKMYNWLLQNVKRLKEELKPENIAIRYLEKIGTGE